MTSLRLAPKHRKTRLRAWMHILAAQVRRVLLLQDTPRRIALGTSLGVFFAAQPFVGSQMAATALFAKICRANVLAGLPWTWLTNPLTVGPFYYACYRLGCCFFPDDQRVSFEKVQAMGAQVEDMTMWETIRGAWSVLIDIAMPLQVGTTLVGALAAFPAYFLIRRVVVIVQARRVQRRTRWLQSIRDDALAADGRSA